MKEFIGLAAGIISFIAYFPYVYSVFKNQTKPSRSSWWIWSFVGFLILLSYYQVGARNTIWIPFVFFICPLVIAILSIWFGEGEKLNKLDKICIFGVFISLIPWIIFKSPQITLSLNIFIDFIGFIPTFRKTYEHPGSENSFTWILFFIGSILNIIAIESYAFYIMSYPLYMLAMDIIMLYFIFIKKINNNKN